jgi:hydroxymethylglutaryl-CoA reductase
MHSGSRLPGFYKLSVAERRALVAARSGVSLLELEAALNAGGIDVITADKLVENVVGTYALPFGLALNVQVNGRDRLVPMVVEEPSVIAAASNAARMVRQGGGFTADLREALMIAQIELRGLSDPETAMRRLRAEAAHLLGVARAAVPALVGRGGGPRALELREIGEGRVVAHVLLDCRDAMGANLANTVAEAVGPVAAEITGAELGLRILSNLCDRRRVRVTCRVHPQDLVLSRARGTSESVTPPSSDGVGATGEEIADAIVSASRFAELDAYRAATHNKGIMNGIDAVVIATGNDFRAVEAGAHAYAALSGRYRPLSAWRRDGAELVGELELPLSLGIVGGTLRVHPVARLALKLLRVEAADELACIAAAVGLASNLAALRALATEGIQRGHMSLHARSVAVAAGAQGPEVELVAARIAEDGSITLEAAQRVVAELRGRAFGGGGAALLEEP